MKFDDLAAAACSFMARPIRRLRWALRRIRRRTLSVDDLWHEDVPAEVEFWRRYLLRMATDLDKGIDPPMLADPDLFRALPLEATLPEAGFPDVWQAHYQSYMRGGLVRA